MSKRNWTLEDDKYIIDNYKKVTLKSMAEHFNCSIGCVTNRVKALGLDYDKKTCRRWTEEEIEQLRLMAEKNLAKTIYKKIDRKKKKKNKKNNIK